MLNQKISSTNCLGVPHPMGQIVLITDDGFGWVSVPVGFPACACSAQRGSTRHGARTVQVFELLRNNGNHPWPIRKTVTIQDIVGNKSNHPGPTKK